MKKLTSFIVTTKNNRRTITYTLNSIKSFAKFYAAELVVVDGTSNDGTRCIVKDFIVHHRNDFYNVNLVQDPGISLSYARNLGFKNSLGDIIVFLDGDMILHPDFVKHFKVLLDSNNFDVVAPHIMILGLERCTRIFNTLFEIIYKKSLHTHKPSIVPQARIFMRDALSKLQGYPILSKYYGEDRVATAISIIKGLRYVYRPELKIIKVDEPSFNAYIRKHIRYGEGLEKDLTYGGKRILRDYILIRRATYINVIFPLISLMYMLDALRIIQPMRVTDFLNVFIIKYTVDLSMLVGELKAILEKIS